MKTMTRPLPPLHCCRTPRPPFFFYTIQHKINICRAAHLAFRLSEFDSICPDVSSNHRSNHWSLYFPYFVFPVILFTLKHPELNPWRCKYWAEILCDLCRFFPSCFLLIFRSIFASVKSPKVKPIPGQTFMICWLLIFCFNRLQPSSALEGKISSSTLEVDFYFFCHKKTKQTKKNLNPWLDSGRTNVDQQWLTAGWSLFIIFFTFFIFSLKCSITKLSFYQVFLFFRAAMIRCQ